MVSEEDVRKVARLAHLAISPDELKKFTHELNSILGHFEKLQAIDVTKIEPTSHVHGSTNIFREDVVQPSLPVKEALKNAPDSSGRFIRVPIIIAQGEN